MSHQGIVHSCRDPDQLHRHRQVQTPHLQRTVVHVQITLLLFLYTVFESVKRLLLMLLCLKNWINVVFQNNFNKHGSNFKVNNY